MFAIGITLSAQTGASLLVPTDAAGLGMGLAPVCLSSDAFDGNRISAGASYSLWAPNGADNQMVSVNARYGFKDRYSARIGVKHLSDRVESMLYNDNGTPLEPYKGSELVMEAGVAMLVLPDLSVDLNLKMLNYNLSTELKGNSFMADLNARYSLKNWRFAFGLENLGYSQLSAVRAGVAYSMDMFKLESEAHYYFAGAFSASIGAELNYRKMIFARVAYHVGSAFPSLPSFASAGMGCAFRNFSVDFAYLFGSETLAGTAMLSLKFAL